jgi:hypothetical protein
MKTKSRTPNQIVKDDYGSYGLSDDIRLPHDLF